MKIPGMPDLTLLGAEQRECERIMHEKLKRLAERLGVAPCTPGAGDITMRVGEAHYEIIDLVNALLDKMEKLLEKIESGRKA